MADEASKDSDQTALMCSLILIRFFVCLQCYIVENHDVAQYHCVFLVYSGNMKIQIMILMH